MQTTNSFSEGVKAGVGQIYVWRHAAPLHSCKYRWLRATATKISSLLGPRCDRFVTDAQAEKFPDMADCFRLPMRVEAVGLYCSSSPPVLSRVLRP